MAATEPQDPPAPPEGEDTGRHWGGIILDVAGLAAGVILLLIVIDIWSDGRISGRLAARRQQPEAEADGAPPGE